MPVPAPAVTNQLIQHIVNDADPGITQAISDIDARGFHGRQHYNSAWRGPKVLVYR